MKSMAEIEMDYRNAMNQARELDQLANRLSTQANMTFPGILSEVSSAWQGENANAYLQKAKKLQPRINKAAGDLRRTAQTIRTVAQNTYRAEKRAYEIAMERVYGG
jgi:uncharacterized protein YukE